MEFEYFKIFGFRVVWKLFSDMIIIYNYGYEY